MPFSFPSAFFFFSSTFVWLLVEAADEGAGTGGRYKGI
jgi:hypothetical protein